MAKVHGGSGSLTDLLNNVADPKITTLSDVVAFTKNFETDKAKIMTEARLAVQKNIEDEKSKLTELQNAATAYEVRQTTASWFGKLFINVEFSRAKRRVDNLKSEIAYMERNPELLAQRYAGQPMSRLESPPRYAAFTPLGRHQLSAIVLGPAIRLLKARILLKADAGAHGEGWSDGRIVEALERTCPW
jgi:hypothetical protein